MPKAKQLSVPARTALGRWPMSQGFATAACTQSSCRTQPALIMRLSNASFVVSVLPLRCVKLSGGQRTASATQS